MKIEDEMDEWNEWKKTSCAFGKWSDPLESGDTAVSQPYSWDKGKMKNRTGLPWLWELNHNTCMEVCINNERQMGGKIDPTTTFPWSFVKWKVDSRRSIFLNSHIKFRNDLATDEINPLGNLHSARLLELAYHIHISHRRDYIHPISQKELSFCATKLSLE